MENKTAQFNKLVVQLVQFDRGSDLFLKNQSIRSRRREELYQLAKQINWFEQQGRLHPSTGVCIVAEAIPNFLMAAGNYGRKVKFIPSCPVQNLFNYHTCPLILATSYHSSSQFIPYEFIDVGNDNWLVVWLYSSRGNIAFNRFWIHNIQNLQSQLSHSLVIFYEVLVPMDLLKAVFLNQGSIVYSLIEHDHQDLFGPPLIVDEFSPNFVDNILSFFARTDIIYASPHHSFDCNCQLNCKIVIFFRFWSLVSWRFRIRMVILRRWMAIGRVKHLYLWPLTQVLLVSGCNPRKKINWFKVHTKFFQVILQMKSDTSIISKARLRQILTISINNSKYLTSINLGPIL